MSVLNDDRFNIPEFLRIPQAERKAAWDNHRIPARRLSAAITADEQWRRDRDKLYREEGDGG